MFFFFFNDTATTEIYTLSLHDALPIWMAAGQRRAARLAVAAPRLLALQRSREGDGGVGPARPRRAGDQPGMAHPVAARSEEHTSELQSRQYLVCRLLLEKKKTTSVHMY